MPGAPIFKTVVNNSVLGTVTDILIVGKTEREVKTPSQFT